MFLFLKVVPCVNSSENNFCCKPREKIHENFIGKSLSYDIESYENPIRSKLRVDYKFIEPSLRKRFIYSSDRVVIKIDSSFFFSEFESKKYWTFRDIAEDFDYFNQTSLFEIGIRSLNIERIKA